MGNSDQAASITARLEQFLAAGQDSATLRFRLANAYFPDAAAKAIVHLEQAVRQDPDFSAAWKLLGKALAASGDISGAIKAYRTGIEVAARRGDKQAEREMKVFLKRLES